MDTKTFPSKVSENMVYRWLRMIELWLYLKGHDTSGYNIFRFDYTQGLYDFRT